MSLTPPHSIILPWPGRKAKDLFCQRVRSKPFHTTFLFVDDPAIMADLREANLVDTNPMRDCLLFASFGSGFTWTFALLRW